MELPKNYEPEESEKKWNKYWEENKIYDFNPESKKEIFSIDTPPPYASADHLHVGHGMHYSQFEFVARFKKLRGYNVFFPMGFDDNGLPTERFVEKKHNVDKTKISRDDFIKLCMKETEVTGKTYRNLFTSLGFSLDWNTLYHTIGPRARFVAQKSFIDLYKKGLLYRKDAPVMWDTKMQTTLAQADLEDIEMKSHFNDIIFKAGKKEVIIATTRPELLPACVALFANPNDERYQDLKGSFATVPIFNYDVPILFDEAVSIDKGTGLMMVCTFGDKEDIEKWQKYNLPLRMAITKDGKMTELAGKYQGLAIKEARKQIIEDLKQENILINQKEIIHAVNISERSGTEIEFIKTKQWYIRVLDKKEELIEQGRKVNWHPQHMRIRYEHWVTNLQWDWCISRQRYYGVPFPIWYSKKTGEIILPEEDELPVDPLSYTPKNLPEGHTKEDIEPESDVMDTWMTSSLSPEINANWGMKDEKKNFLPMSLRPQAHDIIRTWAFYTITKSFYHHNNVPWKDIMMSGHGQDAKGQKMSKSKGNFIEVQEVIKKYGADAFRYWAATVKLGDDLPYQEKDVQTGKKTVTKIWNASKFTIMNLEGFKPSKLEPDKLETMDKWLLSKLMKTVKLGTEAFDNFEYSRCKQETDLFFWQKFCDNYLEFVKHRTYGEDIDEESKISAQNTLYYALLTQLKLFAPIMPFITEEIYQLYFKEFEKEISIHTTTWPEFNDQLIDEEAEKAGDLAVEINSEVRKHKSENKMSLKTEINQITITCTKEQEKLIQKTINDIKATGKVNEIKFIEGQDFNILIS